MHIVCPHCRNPIELVEAAAREEILCPSCGSSFRLEGHTTTGWSQAHGGKVGKFELLETLGQGAFGTVYKARDPELDRTVALKVPRAGLLAEAQELDRFVREARSAAQLQHPSIVPVHEVGTQDGLPYLVSEFVEGVTLADFLTSRQPSFRDSAQLIAQLATALQYAHERGVVHRDVKPSNIMLETVVGREQEAASSLPTDHGPLTTPKLMDFGLAKRDAGEITMTMEGQVLGTPAYMSPEQARGEGHRVDGCSDVYSLGAVLYQLLTGEVPFRGNARMLLWQVLHEDPRPPRKLNDRIPRDLETVCLKALAKEPSRRYPTAAALADDLRRFLNGEAVQARPVGRLERLGKWARRRPAVAALLGVILLAAVALLGGGVWFTLQLNQARHKAESHARDADEKRILAEDRKAEADTARGQADGQTRLAEQRAKDLRESLARLAVFTGRAADDAWDAGRVERANDLLMEIPEEFRGWEWRYRKRRFQGSYCTLYGHTGEVRSVAFSPDGKLLVTASEDGSVRVWDGRTGKHLGTLAAETDPINSVAFSPDGQHLAAGGGDRTVKVWEMRTGKEVLTLPGHAQAVSSIAFSPDGRHLASGSFSKTVKVWEMSTGKELLHLQEHTDSVLSVAFSPDGRHLASAGYDQTVKVWEMPTGKELLTLRGGHTDSVESVAFSPDGKMLASASADKTVKVWDLAGQRAPVALLGHTASVLSVAFSPDGLLLASASFDQTVKVWEPIGGKDLLTLRGHASWVQSVAFSPDGQRLASGGWDKAVKLWRPWARQQQLMLRGHTDGIYNVALSADGQHLASGGSDRLVKVWQAQTGEELLTLHGHTDAVDAVAFSPDGRRLASASWDRTVKVWHAQTGKELLTLRGHTAEVRSVAFSPDGRRLASAGDDSTVRVWDARTGTELRTLSRHTDGVLSVAFSPDGRQLASAAKDMTVRLWDAQTGKGLRTLRGHTDAVSSLAFSLDCQRLATASWDRTMKVWDAGTGEELLTLRGHKAAIDSVAFSPDGQRVASGSWDQTVKVWETRAGRELLTLSGHTGAVWSVAFSRDGERLISAGLDGTVKVWEAQNGPALGTLRGHPAPVQSVTFSSDGRKLFSKDEEGTILAWDPDRGARLPAPSEAIPAAGTGAKHPSRPLLALADGARILLVDLTPTAPGELGFREGMARFDVLWQEEQARKHEEAEHWFAAAFHWGQLAQHEPGNAFYWEKLDAACAKLGSWRPALAVCDRLLAGDPALAPVYFRRARLRGHLLQFHEAAADQLAGLALVARNPVGWPDLAEAAAREGHAYVNRGDWPRACRAFAAAAMWERQNPWHRHRLAWAHLAAGQKAAFVATCRDLDARYRTTADLAPSYRLAAELGLGLPFEPSYVRGLGRPAADAVLQQMQRQRHSAIVRTACLVADHGLPAADLVRLAQANVDARRTWDVLDDLGAAQYRAGQFAAAVKTLEAAVKGDGKGGTNWVKFFLALACQKDGQADRAREWFDRAALPGNADWQERLLFERLRAEATAVMKRDPNPKP